MSLALLTLVLLCIPEPARVPDLDTARYGFEAAYDAYGRAKQDYTSYPVPPADVRARYLEAERRLYVWAALRALHHPGVGRLRLLFGLWENAGPADYLAGRWPDPLPWETFERLR